jgi:hypothetical protein
MIIFAIILAGMALTAFAVVVASIVRSEHRHSLFSPAQGSHSDAFTRRMLGVHVYRPASPGQVGR